MRFDESTLPESFKKFLENTGYSDPSRTRDTDAALAKYPGQIRLSDDYIAESGGLFRAVSRRSAMMDLSFRETDSFLLPMKTGHGYLPFFS